MTTPVGATAPTDLSDHLWDAVMAGDEHAARDVVLAALDAGTSAESVLLDVIGGVQRRVGAAWASAHIDIAQEHAATAINERVIAALAASAPRPARGLGRVTVACVDGEWHALPARLLAETLTMRGFSVDYLGAQVPTPHLIAHLHRTAPDAVALSGSIATRLPVAHSTISACQAAGEPVIVGGAAFGADGRYARLFGAQAWAPDARTAADRLTRAPLPRPQGAHQPVDDLPHLADQEYSLVARSATSLVASMHAGLSTLPPVTRGHDDQQRRQTAENLTHIVEFLATALYVGEDGLFTEFITWSADVLNARGIPPLAVRAALDLLAAELRDLPRASRLVVAGIGQLDQLR
ncbi:cobalamin-binding protein [Actinophytocola xinjiangensis]|uniref:Cobalamin-binding protein n=1 Tax=Actinophytocola xinjiangensis TaxID=485602 RepID=A0A7Z0WH09_9PSEU|nr:cobalamin-dependent protein [Actinophytocola xinjiangensis]OLF07028.1 cobalamin-binding protein [Actinophytocola xinjiangensis]